MSRRSPSSPRLRKLLVILMACLMFAAGCGGSGDTATSVATDTGDAATNAAETPTEAEPDAGAEASLVATTVSGGQIDFGSLEGQDVVLWFWAPW